MYLVTKLDLINAELFIMALAKTHKFAHSMILTDLDREKEKLIAKNKHGTIGDNVVTIKDSTVEMEAKEYCMKYVITHVVTDSIINLSEF